MKQSVKAIHKKRLMLYAILLPILLTMILVAASWLVYTVQGGSQKVDAIIWLYEDRAKNFGLNYAEQQCAKQNVEARTCSSLLATVNTSECEGLDCWIVYISSNSDRTYNADMIVKRPNGQAESKKLIIDNYSTETFKPAP